MSLAEGLRFERRIFHGLFATKDQKEGELVVTRFMCILDILGAGMAAFAEKRKAEFTHS